MTCTVHSTRLGRPVTFSCPGAGGYIYVDLNGLEGTLGNQLCAGGRLSGETLRHEYHGTCVLEGVTLFRATCRRWWRSYLRQLSAE